MRAMELESYSNVEIPNANGDLNSKDKSTLLQD